MAFKSIPEGKSGIDGKIDPLVSKKSTLIISNKMGHKMKPINFDKYKFKIRSLPNSITFPRYFKGFMYFLAVWAAYNFIAICLFYDGFIPRLPDLFVVAIPLAFIHIYTSIESEYKNVTRETIKEVIINIRLSQFQMLKEKIETNPEILKEKLNNKSLLYWAKHYKNLQAHSLLLEELKKLQRK
ncbi:MAG: hypothetical protein H7281_07705 [Bacteriovorax sp.]|nr:hypothetical protein [Bacteriovorax sp.]